ncbi:MAG TPA: HAD family hydrolase [Candidatus Avimonas sp.]|nr:HAD family hydrolase [Clostridiales bacterium]HOB37303.1 HAD family hydrolase [Candidatus Avimonas sp.]HQA16694.1 HAD family hydrolase [Candidatus Avimonas sp.]HQD38801.1 HAD family hydrolase [Candidatus Avimonas sp.]
MPKFKVVVFDLDGTLVNTLDDIAEAANFALAENELPPRLASDYSKLVGNGIYKLAERATRSTKQPVINKFVKDFLWYYDRNCTRSSKPYRWIPEMLEKLHAAGVRMFVVTNKPDEQAQKIIRNFFGTKIFEGVYGNKEGRKTKPDPDLVLWLLRRAGASPAESLFIGDSSVDIFTAINAGMKSAGVAWGFRSVDELRMAGADYIFDKPDEIVSALLG